MAGGYGRNESQGVLDDLYAKAAILDDGHASVALVACDVIGLTRSAVGEARRIIAEKTGIPAATVWPGSTLRIDTFPEIGARSRVSSNRFRSSAAWASAACACAAAVAMSSLRVPSTAISYRSFEAL